MVDHVNRNTTTFCDTLDPAYEYAQAMSNLDFDNVNLTKAQATQQSAWYTCRTSLGTNGVPDKLIEEDLQQPHRIKISFEEGSKDIKMSLMNPGLPEAVTRLSNVGNQLIYWIALQRSLHSC